MPRLDSAVRKAQLLSSALDEAERVTYLRVTREGVAARAGVSPSLISMHFGSAEDFRRAIVAEAIKTKRLRIIAQALAAGHPRALKAPRELREQAFFFSIRPAA